ncbi:tRNA (guanine-N(7)-)-methyltransferase (modular protein) [Desulfamplus magnetovallimortis]|uniref:tRNA (guanine-N(7)-)-methyltransferase n=1 Tax=Desulfamplus magnetovallimortis TaxID=1246637 RepID=A0A1W1HC36_9BACT|nr:tRNA (guanosine(46)-N7)-methyltransferase TrmB [Desulfamplus magnetovallimortis]SLM30057.1 tRNA (guanine-N(7)-)-methyltransferase (modular protein) [Desulfamplus magnetovallimortis]
MPKNKLQKYQRVKELPNVILSEHGNKGDFAQYPWSAGEASDMKITLELGCGKGEHTLLFAKDNPEKFHVGVDYKSHRLCVGAEKALAAGLENVFFLRTRVENLRDFFEPHSIQNIWLTFPDPHPKTRTIKSRLTAPSFLDIYSELLEPGGMVHLKTDSELLYKYTLKCVGNWGGAIIKEQELLSLLDDIPVNDNHPDTSLPQSLGVSRFESNSVTRFENHSISGFESNSVTGFESNSIAGFKSHSISSFKSHNISSFEAAARSKGKSIKYMLFTLNPLLSH